MQKVKEIREIFDSFPPGLMRLEYLIDLGRKSQKEFPKELRVQQHFIHGCTSNAWILILGSDPIKINTVSDSLIISGILYLLEMVFNGESKSSIDSYDAQALLQDLGLSGKISDRRLRGFAVAIEMMKNAK